MQGFGDARVFCPKCGETHDYRFGKYKMRYLGELETAPINVNLTVVEGSDFVSLKVSGQTIRFTELHHVMRNKIDEEFRFNVKARKTIFRRKVDGRLTDEFEIGNPFDPHVFNVSLLYFLTSDSSANLMQKEISRLLKTLRETLHRKIELRCKYKIKSMYVSSGGAHGRLLFPIFNIAFRMVFLDAPNLPRGLREGEMQTTHFWHRYGIYSEDEDDFKDLNYFRKEQNNDYISALIRLYRLPNVRTVRRILKDEFFAYRLLQRASSMTTNVDKLITIYHVLSKACSPLQRNPLHLPDFSKFYSVITRIYGNDAITLLRYLEKDYWYVSDMMRMYERLSEPNRALMPSVKFNDLHDWLAVKIEEQENPEISFDVPEPVRRRLMMQKESIRFFLPEKSTELSAAGKELHNCVGTYSKRMATNDLQIVLVADDNGKLIACLEIRDGALVQARLRYNKPVAQNAKVNAEVTYWAEQSRIRIETSDVREIYLPAVVATAM